jgi:hypothetical protein
MTRAQLIRLYENENGFTPSEDEIELLMDRYHLSDEDTDLPPPRQQQSRIYQFNSRNTASDPINDLFREVKSIFTGLAGSAKRSCDKTEDENLNEFALMALVFLLKAGLYFSLKTAYKKGFDFANL